MKKKSLARRRLEAFLRTNPIVKADRSGFYMPDSETLKREFDAKQKRKKARRAS